MNSVDELMELERESYRRNMARDLAWIKNIHAKSALMFNPGSEITDAHDFLSQRMKSNNDIQNTSDPKFSWEPTKASVSQSDDMGWVYGVITIEHHNGLRTYGKYISVWIREDGEWKVTAEIRNLNS